MNLDKLIIEISDLGLPAGPVLKFLKTAYIALEIPYEREVEKDRRPYPVERLFDVEDWINQFT